MRRIDKQEEPEALLRWKRGNPNLRYPNIDHAVRSAIRAACVREQFYLCAYCCDAIDEGDAVNEHVEPQSCAPHRTLDFANIVASCRRRDQCDNAHGHQQLALTPFMPECETELRFRLSGEIEGLTPRAAHTIETLKLGSSIRQNRNLVHRRRTAIDAALFECGVDPLDPVEDDDLLMDLITDLESVRDGRMKAFAPAISGVLKDWLRDNHSLQG